MRHDCEQLRTYWYCSAEEKIKNRRMCLRKPMLPLKLYNLPKYKGA